MEVAEQLHETPAPGACLNAPAHVSRKYRAIPSVVAALVVPAIFLAYVARYAVNVPVADEWLRIPLIHDSLHGHLTLSALWAQNNETRILLGNVIFVFFGAIDNFDVRGLALFNAAVFIVTYWLLLMVFRLPRPSTRPVTGCCDWSRLV